MAQLLLGESCTVTIAHSRTKDLAEVVRRADIVVAAVGRPEMVPGDWIKPGATVIDVGINRIPAPEKGEGKPRIVGDVAGQLIATANAGEKSKTLKRIIADHLAGAEGRAKVERWVPRWMQFPPSAYTTRGGVGTVAAPAKVVAARDITAAPDPEEQHEPFKEAA